MVGGMGQPCRGAKRKGAAQFLPCQLQAEGSCPLASVPRAPLLSICCNNKGGAPSHVPQPLEPEPDGPLPGPRVALADPPVCLLPWQGFLERMALPCVDNSRQRALAELRSANLTLSGVGERQWYFQTCTEFGYCEPAAWRGSEGGGRGRPLPLPPHANPHLQTPALSMRPLPSPQGTRAEYGENKWGLKPPSVPAPRRGDWKWGCHAVEVETQRSGRESPSHLPHLPPPALGHPLPPIAPFLRPSRWGGTPKNRGADVFPRPALLQTRPAKTPPAPSPVS